MRDFDAFLRIFKRRVESLVIEFYQETGHWPAGVRLVDTDPMTAVLNKWEA